MKRGAVVLATGLLISSVQAEVPPPAYQLATHGTSVPSEVLYALALQESGTRLNGKLVPWPWTLNVATVPQRFATRNAACKALLQAIQDVGPKRVDAGLGQLNIGWQRHLFSQPCDVLDPYFNLALTTRVLLDQKSASDNWIEAAGRYHRPAGGPLAARYRDSFAKHLHRVTATSSTQGEHP